MSTMLYIPKALPIKETHNISIAMRRIYTNANEEPKYIIREFLEMILLQKSNSLTSILGFCLLVLQRPLPYSALLR